MRTVSRVRKSIVWIFKLLFERQLQSCTERIRLCVSMFGTQLHRQGCVSIGNKNVPDRVRFTRALLESKDLSMWFFFPCAFGAPGSAPAPWKQPLRKDLQDPLFPEAGMWGS